jgi:hypothetical protein
VSSWQVIAIVAVLVLLGFAFKGLAGSAKRKDISSTAENSSCGASDGGGGD